MTGYTKEMARLLRTQRMRYPLMTAEDVVKFAFQGMLGVGHLIASEEAVLRRLHEEMSGLAACGSEPLFEQISPDWVRINLRAAMAEGIGEDEICRKVWCSAGRSPLPFTRRDVYDFCVGMDGSDIMRAAPERVLDGAWLPSHSLRYRRAYHPAYRVLHCSCC